MWSSYRESSPHTFAITVDGEVAGIFGVASMGLEGVGAPWLLCTPLIHRCKRGLVREAKDWVAYLNMLYPTLTNIVHSESTQALRWIEAMGFVFTGETEEVEGNLFRRFTRCRLSPPSSQRS